MPRIVLTQPASATYPGTPFSFKRGEVIEASAGLIGAIGANARNCTAGAGRGLAGRDDTGEPFGVANSSAWTAPVKDDLAPLWPYLERRLSGRSGGLHDPRRGKRASGRGRCLPDRLR